MVLRLLDYGFQAMNLHSINLTVYADNYGGMKRDEKVGSREVGRLPKVFL